MELGLYSWPVGNLSQSSLLRGAFYSCTLTGSHTNFNSDMLLAHSICLDNVAENDDW